MVDYQLSKGAVLALLHEAGVVRQPIRLTGEQIAQAAHHYQRGESCEQIARRYGVVAKTIWSALTRAGVDLRAPQRSRQEQTRLSVEDIAWLVAEYEAGATISSLAGQFKLYPATVTDHVKRSGAVLRNEYRAKLTRQQKLVIRQRFGVGDVTMTSLAAEFGVSRTCISQVLGNKSMAGS